MNVVLGDSHAAGFTLMELLIVLSIAGLLVSLSAPLYSSAVPGARAKAEVNELIVTLRDTANAAVSAGRETHVRFDPQTMSYAAGNSRPVALGNGTELIVEASLDPTRRPADDSEDGIVTMSFFPDGSSTGGTILLRRASSNYMLGVDWLTGRVEVLEHAGDAR